MQKLIYSSSLPILYGRPLKYWFKVNFFAKKWHTPKVSSKCVFAQNRLSYEKRVRVAASLFVLGPRFEQEKMDFVRKTFLFIRSIPIKFFSQVVEQVFTVGSRIKCRLGRFTWPRRTTFGLFFHVANVNCFRPLHRFNVVEDLSPTDIF